MHDLVSHTCQIYLLQYCHFKRIGKYLSHQSRITFYNSYISTHIDYCNTVWDQSPHVNRIHIVQEMALRLIMNVPKTYTFSPRFHQCGVMLIQNNVKLPTVTKVYKSLNGLTSDMFQQRPIFQQGPHA